MTKSCLTCRHCTPSPDGNMAFAMCGVVRDPVDGEPLQAIIARRDIWEGYVLPCKYEGYRWEAREDG